MKAPAIIPLACAAVVFAVWARQRERRRQQTSCSDASFRSTRNDRQGTHNDKSTRKNNSKGGSSKGKQQKGRKKKLLQLIRDPSKLRAPQTDRQLPHSLATETCAFDVDLGIASGLASAMADELLGLKLSDETVFREVAGYKISETMKTTCKSGNMHHALKKCSKFLDLYHRFIREVVGPHILREFEKEGANRPPGECPAPSSEASTTVLYQFPPTIRIYSSHIGKRDTDKNRQKITTPPQGEKDREHLIQEEQALYRSVSTQTTQDIYKNKSLNYSPFPFPFPKLCWFVF